MTSQVERILRNSIVTGNSESNIVTPSGKKYFLEEADWPLFLTWHSADCLAGTNDYFLIEQKTEIFNLFFDLDFKEEIENKEKYNLLLTLLHKTLVDTIRLFFNSDQVRIVTSKKECSPNIHFNLPDIHVRNETAMSVRSKFLENLFYQMEGDWDSIVDASVLKSKNTGLRMLGCPKVKKGTNTKLDQGYKVITWDDTSKDINYLDVTVQHLQDTLIRFDEGKETPCNAIETFTIDSPQDVDDNEISEIGSYITHEFRFSKKINNFIYIFLNQGPRRCMISLDKTHTNNNFYVKRNMSNEYYYHCHHEQCSNTPLLLFKKETTGDFDKTKIMKIADENRGKKVQEVSKEILGYLNEYFSYILKQDCFMETRGEDLYWYKVLNNRLNFLVDCEISTKNKKGEDIIAEKNLSPQEIFTKSAFRQEFDNVVFEPYLKEKIETNRNYNLFNGFKQDYSPTFQVDISKIEPLLYHFKHVWCKGDETVYNYLISWYADLIQNPGTLPGIAVVVQGKQGAGKGSICNFVGNKVIGRKYYSSVNEISQLLGQFNSKIMNKILICCDEVANFGGAIQNNNKLKGLITEPFQSVRMLFKEPMDIKSCSRYVFLTNNEWPVKVETNDRRYFCLQTDDKFVGNTEYFKNLYKHFTDEVAEHFFHYLAEYDLSKWNKHQIPMTKFRRELMSRDLPTPIQFILNEIKTNGEIADEILVDELYNLYNSWCHLNLKTEHKKELQTKFVETICFNFDAILVKKEVDSFDRSQNENHWNFDGRIGNAFLLKNQETFDDKIAVKYGFHKDIGV